MTAPVDLGGSLDPSGLFALVPMPSQKSISINVSVDTDALMAQLAQSAIGALQTSLVLNAQEEQAEAQANATEETQEEVVEAMSAESAPVVVETPAAGPATFSESPPPLLSTTYDPAIQAAGESMLDEQAVKEMGMESELVADQSLCPECGAVMIDGVCPECGYTAARAIAYGQAAKALPDDPYRIRTRGVVWGGYDLLGDQFVRGETDLGASRSFVGMPVYWGHADFEAKNPVKSQIGTVVYVDENDQGIDFDIELDRSLNYIATVKELEAAGLLGSSTGAIDYLVKRKQGKLKRWIIGEISLTNTPMEPRSVPVLRAAKAIDGADVAPATMEAHTMGNEAPTITDPGADVAQQIKALQDEVADYKARVTSVRSDLDTLQGMPAVKDAAGLGGQIGGGLHARKDEFDQGQHDYHNLKALRTFSYAGGTAKPAEYPEGVFGGFVKALFNAHKVSPTIQRDAIKALTEVYGSDSESPAAKSLGTQAGVTAAYLLPEQFIPSLMMIAAQNDVFYGRTMVIPADGGEIVIPALDPSTAYSAGQSAYYGGVTVTWGNDDASSTDTTPNFKQVRLRTNAIKASTRVKNQLMMRSAVAIDAIVSQLIGGAIGRARDYALIQGDGNGKPLGFMFSPAAIDQGGSAIDFATLAGMNDNVIPERDDNYIWLIHSKKRSAIWSLQQTNNALVTVLPDLRGKPGVQLLGRPIAFTDKTPYSNSDVSNTVNLVDPSMYVTAEFQGIAFAVSDQARFEQDETVIRAIMSIDGQPWLQSKISVTSTPDYVSGFVTI